MKTAKVFRRGNSQAIRISKEYAIDDSELYIHKIGNSIILTSKDDIWTSIGYDMFLNN